MRGMIGKFSGPYAPPVQPAKFEILMQHFSASFHVDWCTKLMKLFESCKQLSQESRKIYFFFGFVACQSFVAVERSSLLQIVSFTVRLITSAI